MLEYSIWSETNGNETSWFWLVDDAETNVAGGIENTEQEAMTEIRKYIPNANQN